MSAKRRWTAALESFGLVALSLAACVLVIDLASKTYWRVDASLDGRNTLAPEIADRIEKLPGEVTVDVFFRPLPAVFDRAAGEARARFLQLLYQARNARRDRLSVTVHDLSDLATVRTRQRELGVDGTQLVVFSSGARRATFGLFDDVAEVDWGNPTTEQMEGLREYGLLDDFDPRTWNPDPRAFRPPFLARFRGEEVLATGLAKVSSGEPPRVRFLVGHKGPALDSSDERGLAQLVRGLAGDGFRVDAWDPGADAGVPADTDVLAIVGPEQPLEPRVHEAIHGWVDAGGRLFLAPSFPEALERLEGGAASLGFRYGMVLEQGVVCEAWRDSTGIVVEGRQDCATFVVHQNGLSASHPVTQPLRERGARVRASLTASFKVGQHPGGAQPLAIVSSPKASWLDVPDADGRLNFRRDGAESSARRALVLAATYTPEGQSRPAKILGVGSSFMLVNANFGANRDLLLNAFNNLADRDERIGVAPRARRERRLDLRGGGALATLGLSLRFVLPGLFIVVGAVLAWRRRA